jgi:hypothetical protein
VAIVSALAASALSACASEPTAAPEPWALTELAERGADQPAEDGTAVDATSDGGMASSATEGPAATGLDDDEWVEGFVTDPVEVIDAGVEPRTPLGTASNPGPSTGPRSSPRSRCPTPTVT